MGSDSVEQEKLRVETAKRAMKAIEADQRERLDQQQAFLIYATLGGDLDKVSAALSIKQADLQRMAEAGDWQTKLATLIRLKQGKQGKEVDRAINRANNFVLAHRFRLTLERMVCKLDLMSDEELLAFCWCEISRTKKDGSVESEKRLNFRSFADLASALEKVQMLSYAALNDTASERVSRARSESPKEPEVDVHAHIAEAMAKANRDANAQGRALEPTPAPSA
jgi:hypothetical protein